MQILKEYNSKEIIDINDFIENSPFISLILMIPTMQVQLIA